MTSERTFTSFLPLFRRREETSDKPLDEVPYPDVYSHEDSMREKVFIQGIGTVELVEGGFIKVEGWQYELFCSLQPSHRGKKQGWEGIEQDDGTFLLRSKP